VRVKKLCTNIGKKNNQLEKKVIVKHFINLGWSKSSVYRWVNTLASNQSLERKVGSGRPPFFGTKRNISKIKNYFNQKSGVSQKNGKQDRLHSSSYNGLCKRN
jgi:hypothetical protein